MTIIVNDGKVSMSRILMPFLIVIWRDAEK